MYKQLFSALVLVLAVSSLTGCTDKMALAESSFGKLGEKNAKASSFAVISMGRDDDDGKAKKWHIGGREEEKLKQAVSADTE